MHFSHQSLYGFIRANALLIALQQIQSGLIQPRSRIKISAVLALDSILSERDIQSPVQIVFDAPVLTQGCCQYHFCAFVIPTDRTDGTLDLRRALTGFLVCAPCEILHDTAIFETYPSIKHFPGQQ